jgi:hypothetical protein
VKRYKSAIVHVRHEQFSFALSNTEESPSFYWRDRWFHALPNVVGIYDYLRCAKSSQITGIELQLATSEFHKWLTRLAGFTELPPTPTFPFCWRFMWSYVSSDIQWDQIFSNNPLLASDGSALLILQLSHLDQQDYNQIESLVTKFG